MNEVVDPSRVAEVEDIVRRNTTAAYRAPEVLNLTVSTDYPLCEQYECIKLSCKDMCGMQMYDLWSGNRINTQVDIFVRSLCHLLPLLSCNCALLVFNKYCHISVSISVFDEQCQSLPLTTPSLQALGVLLYLMCFSQFPFQADDKLSVIRGRYNMPPSQHRPATRNLIAQMLYVDPAQRPDIHAVVASVKSLLEGGHAAPATASAATSNPALPQAIPQAGTPQPSMNHVPPTLPNGHVPHAHAHAPAHSPQQHHPQVVHPGVAHAGHHAQPHPSQAVQGAAYPGTAQYPPQMVAQQQAPALQHPGAVQLQMPATAHNSAPHPGVQGPAMPPGVPHHAPGVPHTAHAVNQFDPFPQNAAAAQKPPADPAAAYDPYAAPAPPPPPEPTDPFGQATPSGVEQAAADRGVEAAERMAPATYPAVLPAVQQGATSEIHITHGHILSCRVT